ncbi:MAG: hypothetical protein J5737_03670 [Bacteroidales bacterium]|nr:hypothetical protein [Bacteroidales bacterium]
MKLTRIISAFIIAAGLFVLTGCGKGYHYSVNVFPTNSPQTISKSGTASLTFKTMLTNTTFGDGVESDNYATLRVSCTVTATGGTVSPTTVQSDGNGMVTVVFTAANASSFEGGTVTVTPTGILGLGEDDEIDGLTAGTGTVLPLSEVDPPQPPTRPSKEKVKPKIFVVQEPARQDNGKTVFVVRVTEAEVGSTKEEPVAGQTVTFESDREKGTFTETAVTDEKGDARCEYEPKDAEHFPGAEVKAKAQVLYSDGTVDVETSTSIPKAVEYVYALSCLNSPQTIDESGVATLRFELSGMADGEHVSTANAVVAFSATGGSCNVTGITDANGVATCVFTAPDPATFEEGSVYATCSVNGQFADASGIVLGLPQEPISIAKKLDDNTYVVQKKGEGGQTYPLTQKYSEWYVGRASMDKNQQAVKVMIMDEDPDDSTKGWSMSELPEAIVNKLTTINQEFMQKYPWAATKFGTFRTGKEVNVHMGQGGNVNLDGSSQILLREKTGTKSYSGQLQFLFVFTFTNESWDSASQTFIPDGEYTVYGNAIVEESHPELNYFTVNPVSDWVQVGQSVAVEMDWSDGASFDPSKVKLAGQTLGYSSSEDEDEGYFSWNASTATLTALKSSGNQNVYLKFRYEGTSLGTTCQLASGPGWNYTSFSFTPSQIVMHQYGIEQLNVENYSPSDEGWDWAAVEIDPDSNPDGAFWLDNSNTGKLYNFSGKNGQTYNLRFRIKSNHQVTAPLQVSVVYNQ